MVCEFLWQSHSYIFIHSIPHILFKAYHITDDCDFLRHTIVFCHIPIYSLKTILKFFTTIVKFFTFSGLCANVFYFYKNVIFYIYVTYKLSRQTRFLFNCIYKDIGKDFDLKFLTTPKWYQIPIRHFVKCIVTKP